MSNAYDNNPSAAEHTPQRRPYSRDIDQAEKELRAAEAALAKTNVQQVGGRTCPQSIERATGQVQRANSPYTQLADRVLAIDDAQGDLRRIASDVKADVSIGDMSKKAGSEILAHLRNANTSLDHAQHAIEHHHGKDYTLQNVKLAQSQGTQISM